LAVSVLLQGINAPAEAASSKARAGKQSAVSKAGFLPAASRVLGDALLGPGIPFEGTVFTTVGRGKSKKSLLRCSPAMDSGLACRREYGDPKGGVRFVSATDGAREWAFDAKLNKVWEGPAPAGQADPSAEAGGQYRIALSTGGKVAGRPTWRLDLLPSLRVGLGRRLWVDREHKLILKEETLLPDGTVALRRRFSKVVYGGRHDPGQFRPEPVPGASRAGRLEPEPAERGRIAADAGFPPRFPDWLPSGFVLNGVDLIPYKDKKIVHCRYSDGAVLLSLFQAPPRARVDLGSKARADVRLASGQGFASWTEDAGVLGWASGDTKLVLVAPMGLETLRRVAESVR
jgi:hypothetical protein